MVGGGGGDRSRLLDVFTHFARAMNIYWNRRKFSYNNKVQLTNLADTNLAAVFFPLGHQHSRRNVMIKKNPFIVQFDDF